MVLGRGAEEISVPPIPDTFLDTIVDGDADDSHENKETNNYARHATSFFPESTAVLLPRPSATVGLVTPHTPVRGAEEAPQVSGVAILGHVVLIIVTHLGQLPVIPVAVSTLPSPRTIHSS